MKHLRFFSIIMINFFVFFSPISAEVFFNGTAGVKANVQSNTDSEDFDPLLLTQSFFIGQWNFSQNLTFRADFSLKTEDLLENGIFEDTDAKLSTNELSLTTSFLLGNIYNYLSFFSGAYESVGSDIFLQRYFGIENIDSMITENWGNNKNSSVHPIFGVGASYLLKMNIAPIISGIYVYVNHEDTTKNELNADLRFACVFDNFTLDLSGGAGAPLKSENSTTDTSFLVIDELFLHGGIEMFIGNSASGGIFTEVGIQNTKYTKTDGGTIDYSVDNLFLLVEPRIVFKKAKLNIGFFNIPEKKVSDLVFINDTMGVNVTLYSDNFHIKNNSVEFGTHLTYSVPGKNIGGKLKSLPSDAETEDPNFKISPFFSILTKSGKFQTMLQILTTDLSESWEDSIKLSVSYQAYF